MKLIIKTPDNYAYDLANPDIHFTSLPVGEYEVEIIKHPLFRNSKAIVLLGRTIGFFESYINKYKNLFTLLP